MSATRPQQQRGPGYLDDYVGVHTRIEKFYEKYPEGRILTELLPLDGQPELVCFKAFIYRDRTNEQADATGHSIDRLDLTRSTFEKLETAAVGRALAMLGFEVKKGIASHEEIEKAERNERHQRPQAVPLRSPAAPAVQCEKTGRQAPAATDQWQVPDAVKSEILDFENATAERTGRTVAALRQFVVEKFSIDGPHKCAATQLNMYKAWLKSQK